METPRIVLSLCCLVLSWPALAQETPCKPISPEAATQLTFRERACWYADRLFAPSTILQTAVLAGFADVRNSPHLEDDGWDGFGRRLGVFYARRTGQSAGEFIAGYLTHQDPRPHTSGQHGIWNRTRSALLSVMVAQDAEGDRRPALAPIAGAFGSGMLSVPFYRQSNSMEDGLARTGLTYGAYFGTALFREFQPDLSGFASHLLGKKKHD